MNIKLLVTVALTVLANLNPASAQNTFKLASTLNSTVYVGNPAQVIATDMNGDGRVDLIGGGMVLTNNGKGVFTAFQTTALNIRSNSFLVADVNRDGKMDLIALTNLTVAPYTESIVVYTNSGNSSSYPYNFFLGNYSSTTNVGNETVFGQVVAQGSLVSAGDVAGNGLVNLFYFNSTNTTVCLFTNNGSGAFGSNFTFSAKMSAPVAADVNRDGKVDFVSLG
jgi:hypothetical protein